MSGLWPAVVRVRRAGGRPDVVLRPLRRRDRAEWEALRQAQQGWLRPWEAGSPRPGRSASFGRLVRYYDAEGRAGRAQSFVVEVDGCLVGQVQLSQLVWGSSRSAVVGYWTAQQWAGRGIAPAALSAVVDRAFGPLALHRLVAYVQLDNQPSTRVMEKLGFVDEGVARGVIFVNGEWRDHRCFSLLREDVRGRSWVDRWNEVECGGRPT
ncbi:ribosomal-protein-alanine N-acetyltransferase [Austwickia chelonae]|uniref:Putative acetyltransferase n=1 Tax=Austwickia chelonae NBRC 105200 TaxID=1184607 RepID=K6W843_9MICO|nr:GNAT family protein [Austwickia chelonae]GAB77982.1 putative acetyltransferase [Austwickia chelonae NBRC 105200]SEV93620.1 ribosomal-protein-alanine N-acetyltransferase [Austwickia chelonae]